MMGNYLTIIHTQLLTKVQVSTPEMNVLALRVEKQPQKCFSCIYKFAVLRISVYVSSGMYYIHISPDQNGAQGAGIQQS